MNPVSLGFLPKVIEVQLDNLLPLKVFAVTLTGSTKFKQVMASIKELGLIEPLIVGPLDRKTNKHPLLDGHLRLVALRELGVSSAACLISTDDEAYTYNKRVNRLSTIQEHVMIRRAIERGVSSERLASALAVDVQAIATKLRLLDGICAEALHLLRDREFSPGVTAALKRMKPTRQIEAAEMMIAANCVMVSYARALLAATTDDLLVDKRKNKRTASHEQISLIERETETLRARYRATELTYADDMLNLVVARGYVAKLLAHPAIDAYLRKWHAELHPELNALAAMSATDE